VRQIAKKKYIRKEFEYQQFHKTKKAMVVIFTFIYFFMTIYAAIIKAI